MGRVRRPVYERGPGGGADAAAQAGLAAGDRDRAPRGVPARPVTPFLQAVRHRAGWALTAMFAEYFRPSLRRRIALALATTFAVGYLILRLVLTVSARWPILLIPAIVLALAPWGWWFVAGR